MSRWLRRAGRSPKPAFGGSTPPTGATLRFAKPTRAEREHREAAERQDANAIIAATREEVFRLDVVCGACGGRPRQTDEMHEVVSRAKTRGLPPTERFNRRVCIRLHRTCHHQTTLNEIRMAFLDTEAGIDGGLLIQQRGSEEITLYRRGARPTHRSYGFGVGTVYRGIWTPLGDVGWTDALRDAEAGGVAQPVRRSS
jgi:hypothetical protein